MNRHLKNLLLQLGEEYRDNISAQARHYVEVSLEKLSEKKGGAALEGPFKGACAVIPLKTPAKGMKVRIDGRTFVNYGQFDSGIAVPGYVAKEAGLPYKTFVPNDSMILNFA